MRTLAAVNYIFAAALLLFGVFALLALGVTGLIFVVPGIAFAFIAGVVRTGARASIPLAAAADGLLCYVASGKVTQAMGSESGFYRLRSGSDFALSTSTLDLLVFGTVLLLVGLAAIAVVLDWKAVQRARWF